MVVMASSSIMVRGLSRDNWFWHIWPDVDRRKALVWPEPTKYIQDYPSILLTVSGSFPKWANDSSMIRQWFDNLRIKRRLQWAVAAVDPGCRFWVSAGCRSTTSSFVSRRNWATSAGPRAGEEWCLKGFWVLNIIFGPWVYSWFPPKDAHKSHLVWSIYLTLSLAKEKYFSWMNSTMLKLVICLKVINCPLVGMAGFFGFLSFYGEAKVGLPATIPITPIRPSWLGLASCKKMRSVNVPLFSNHIPPVFFFWTNFDQWYPHLFLVTSPHSLARPSICKVVCVCWLFNIFQDCSFHVNSSNSCHVARVTSDTFWHFHAPAMDPGAPTRAPVSATSALQPSAWSASRASAEYSPRKYLSKFQIYLILWIIMLK